MILQLAEISVKPFKEVLTRFKKYRAKGWGARSLCLLGLNQVLMYFVRGKKTSR